MNFKATIEPKLPKCAQPIEDPSRMDIYQALMVLEFKYAQTASNKFKSAREETTEYGRRFIEHGAHCYFNMANDLKAILKAYPQPTSSGCLSQSKTSTKHPAATPAS